MENEKREPKIRFAGYDEEWVEKRFGDAFDMMSNNTLSRDNLNYKSGEALNVHYGDILIKLGEYTDTDVEGLPYISDSDLVAKFQSSFLKDGDIVIADTAEDEAVGKCTEIVNVGDKKIIAGLHTMPCRPKESFAPKYLGYYLNSNSYQNQLKALMQGVKVLAISRTGIQDTALIVSLDEKEQERIGALLSTLDEKIKLEEQKKEKLRILKQSMLVKMFPQNGSKVPEIRFDGFTGDWKQCKLGEISNKITTKNSGTQYVETFTNSAEYGIISQRDFFDHDITNMEKIDGYYVVEDDAFVYNPRISALAPVGPINRNKLGRTGVMSPLYTVFKTYEVCNDYLEWFFKSNGWHSFMRFNGDSGARSDRFSIKDSVFFEMPIPIPDIGEQKKIGKYFTELENLIALNRRKLEKLRNIKSAFMEKMFL